MNQPQPQPSQPPAAAAASACEPPSPPAPVSGAAAAAELAARSAQPWTTLAQLAGDPAVAAQAAREFKNDPRPEAPPLASPASDPGLFPILGQDAAAAPAPGKGVDRRKFLQWSTAAMALASAACARKPVHYLVPYADQPSEILPGMPNFYATTCQECSASCGLVVKTRDGRPIKVEGNPLHPINRGTVCARGQATFLNLYDPDRLPHPIRLVRGQVPPPAAGPRVPYQYFNDSSPMQIYNLNGDPGAHPPQITPGMPLAWGEIDKEISAQLRQAGAGGVLLTGTIHGPARTRLLADFTQFFGTRRVIYDAFNPDALAAAQAASYGAAVIPRYFFGRAEMVVTFGANPLAQGASPLEYSVGFGRQRKLRLTTGGNPVAANMAARKDGYGSQRMSRVVAFEPAMSQTGMNADTRHFILPQDLLPVALALAHQLVVVDQRSAFAGNAQVQAALAPFAPAEVAKAAGLPAGVLARTARELWAHRGKGLVYASGLAAQTPLAAELEAVACFLNAALENEGATIDGTLSPSRQQQGSDAAMLALCDDMRAGRVPMIVIYGTNPAYTLPAGADFAAALAKVPYVVTIAERLDETGRLSNVVLTSLHGQESWGDAEPQTGLYSLVQPTIEPLFDGRGFEDHLIAFARAAGSKQFQRLVQPPAPAPAAATAAAPAAVAGAAAKAAKPKAAAKPAAPAPPAKPKLVPMDFHAYIQQVWQKEIYGKYQLAGTWEDFWTGVLRDGYFDPNAVQRANPGKPRAFRPAALAAAAKAAAQPLPRPHGEEFALSLVVSPMVGDGRCDNNGFLLEVSDPVAKICWDNFLSISPAAAKRLGLVHGDVVEVAANGHRLQVPIHHQPGVNPHAAALQVGWGRTSVGMIGNQVGVNAYPLAAAQDGKIVFSGAIVRLVKVGSGYNLAEPQGSNYLEGRDVALATTLARLRSNPRAGNVPAPPDENIWHNGGPSDHTYTGHHWGMTIDMNACIGCNACMVACHSENNVPVVGREQVQVGREMHWIRIDRYYTGSFENPSIILEPMLCQQCANASCESVCPVIATITNGEGVNVQVYNRCVGTRFCSNNCPYKVRRFNFYAYGDIQYERGAPIELALNPDVTLRSRGIMEKCNYCIQRINEAHVKYQRLGAPIPDGGIQTACQQTCPAQAIYFGDMNNPDSEMMQARGPRGYKVLAGVNNLPTIDYQLKVYNTPQAASHAIAREEKA